MPVVDLDTNAPAVTASQAVPATVKTLTADPSLGAKLSPAAEAGFRLAKYVLVIVAATVLLLLFYLVFTDWRTDTGLGASYADLLARASSVEAISNPEALDNWEAALRIAVTDTTASASSNDQKSERQLLASLNRASLISDKQNQALEICVDMAKTSPNRVDAIDECLDILRLLKKVQSSTSANTTLVASVSKDFSERTQTEHAFWIQMAQLLLLNLLLPLLTGLFGYIFGTNQQSGSA